MAWACSGRTNIELVNNLHSYGLIRSPRVVEAMRKVDRAKYVPTSGRSRAYEDSPQGIGHNATISAPHMHAHAAEMLLPYLRPGNSVLDVGSGSGYLLALFHHLVTDGNAGAAHGSDSQDGRTSRVVGIEHIPELVDYSKENLRNDGLGDALASGKIDAVAGDGRAGYPDRAPYNAIHVGAAAPTFPENLVQQLAKPGRLIVPVDDPTGTAQDMWQIDKDKDGKVTRTKLFGVVYVPLTDVAKQRNRW